MNSDDLKNKCQNIDSELSNREIDLDPLGYFIIKADLITKKITAEHYLNKIDGEGIAIDPITNKPIDCDSKNVRKWNQIFTGNTAKEVGILITEKRDDLISKFDHALYMGRELQILGKSVPSVPGKNISLSIDIRLQQVANEAMKGESGAVIVMNPKTGDILALASFPDFDPNLFSGGIDHKNWNILLNNPEDPMGNKAIQGLYAPGSIFKVVTAYAGLDLGAITLKTEHVCKGTFTVKGREEPYKCWKEEGHGKVSLLDAIKGSCNVYFYNVGMEIGVDVMHKYANLFGLGQLTGLGLMNEKEGLIPSSKWKKRALKEQWYEAENTAMAIGQGYIIVTPLQVINMINILANKGKLIPPKLFLEQDGLLQHQLYLKEEHMSLIRKGMIAVVNENGGTARKVQFEEFTVAGKTATSQVVSHKTLETMDNETKAKRLYQNHAWFVAFGPAGDPEISVLALVEHGGGGSKAAAPVVRKILSYYIDNIYKPKSEKTTKNNPKSRNHDFTKLLQIAFNEN